MGAHFDIGQVQVAFEQMIGEVAPDRGTPFAFRLTRRKVTDKIIRSASLLTILIIYYIRWKW